MKATLPPVLAALCRQLGLSLPEPEYVFAPPRKWRFDYAWPAPDGGGVALEIQGGLFVRGRHSRGPALLKEHEKLNRAAALNWRIVYCTPQQFASGEALGWVAEAVMVPKEGT